MFVSRSVRNEQSVQRTFQRCFLPSFGSFGKTVSEKKNFKNQSFRNKSCLWRKCLLTNLDEMSNLYRGPSIDASLSSFGSFGQAVSEEKFFLNHPIRNKNCLWQPCLLMDRDEISKLYREPPTDDSYQVSVHLAKGIQRRRLKCEKLMDDRWQTTDAKWWQKFTLPLARWA